jgi:hypothetical protein
MGGWRIMVCFFLGGWKRNINVKACCKYDYASSKSIGLRSIKKNAAFKVVIQFNPIYVFYFKTRVWRRRHRKSVPD